MTIDPEIIGIVYLAVKALTTGRHEANTKRVLRVLRELRGDIAAIKDHLGIEVRDGKTIHIRRSAEAAAAYQDATAKP